MSTESTNQSPPLDSVPLHPIVGRLCCDACGQPTYPDWSRCIHCAHYFCAACQSAHGCGTRFRSAEQLEQETTTGQGDFFAARHDLRPFAPSRLRVSPSSTTTEAQ